MPKKKTKIISLSYNAMFKAIFSKNRVLLTRFIKAILDYFGMNIDIQDKKLIIKNNELPADNYYGRQLICDYIIELNEENELNFEMNRTSYIGITERNMTYGFKIYCNHFENGDKYGEFKKYNLLQINFNKFPNPNHKNIIRYLLIDAEDVTNVLSKNMSIVNIDIDSCYKLVYNSINKKEISDLERFSAILTCEYLEDISNILGSDMFSMSEKDKLLKQIKDISSDRNIQEAVKLEDSIDYRFKLVEEDALERGIGQGIEQGIEQGKVQGKEETLRETIKSMLENSIDLNIISKVTGKSIKEIEKIKNSSS